MRLKNIRATFPGLLALFVWFSWLTPVTEAQTSRAATAELRAELMRQRE